jgi:hypothetical protein
VIKDILEAGGMTTNRQQGIEVFTTPRVVVQINVGSVRRFTPAPGLFARPERLNATLHLGIVTNRATNRENHGEYRAKVRELIYSLPHTAGMPYHLIESVEETGTTPSIETDKGYDTSTITFAMVFGIKQSAWPLP